MKIALVGGTGPFGMGLALRWAEVHEILLGSRSHDRARSACERIKATLGGARARSMIDPYENFHAIQEAEVVVPCIGYEHAITTIRDLTAGFGNQIVISPLSPMMGSEGNYHYLRPKEGSAAMQLATILPEKTKIVSCFQALPASKLLDPKRTLNFDVPVFTDSNSARKKTFDLIRDIRYLKPLYGGPLELAYLGEMLGPLWLNMASLNKMRDPSIKFPE